jgi:hypothetical protein
MAKVTKKGLTVDDHVAAIFEQYPHITTVWIDENSEWRFYETPGAIAIERGDVVDAPEKITEAEEKTN